jgi:hypothetical protein
LIKGCFEGARRSAPRHPGAGRDPERLGAIHAQESWAPACAGETRRGESDPHTRIPHRLPGLDPGSRFFIQRSISQRDPGSSPGRRVGDTCDRASNAPRLARRLAEVGDVRDAEASGDEVAAFV